jgi:hypothetical protein
MFAGLLPAHKLWLSERFYPQTPVWPSWKPLPFPFDVAALLTLLVLLLLIAAAPKPARWIAAFAVLAIALALLDQSRWQPWFYQYLFMLIAVGLGGEAAALNTCRLIVVSIYLWSGLQKAHSHFTGDVFPWLIEPALRFLPSSLAPVVSKCGIIIPIVEAALALGLLTRRFRNAAVLVAIATHTLILLSIGPLGHNANTVVWPWNIAMAAFVFILFWRTDDFSFSDLVWGKNFAFQKVVLVLFGLAPALSFFNLWDNYLSAALYAGNKNQAIIYFDASVVDRLPETIKGYVEDKKLDVSDWSYGELNVPPYPEVRIYKNVARSLCRYGDVKLVVRGKAVLFNGFQELSFDCSSLSNTP